MSRPSYLLDIGAGSGLSGEILTEEGHDWVGMDVSGGMLGKLLLFPSLATAFAARGGAQPHSRLWPSFVQELTFCFLPTEVALEREVEGDLFLADIGQGVPFRPGSFDGAISYATALATPRNPWPC